MKLSIIWPVYNMAADGSLDFCIKSLLAQTIRDYEIIAIDNKSIDNSLEVLKSYEKNYPDKVKVIASSDNRYQGGAYNLGLRAVTGEWISFINDRDWIAPDYFEKLFEKAAATGADIVGCNYSIKYTRDYEIGERIYSDYSRYTGEMNEEKYKATVLNADSIVAGIYKYSIFWNNGIWFPEYMFYETNTVDILAMLYCGCFAYVDEPLYYKYEASIMYGSVAEKCNDRMQTMEILLGECYKRGFLDEYSEELEYRFTDSFYVTTLFTYMRQVPFYKRKLSFLRLLRDGILAYYPEYATNSYFEEKQDVMIKKTADIHCKSPFLFLWYYTILHFFQNNKK
ncbi:MAG: glycosyltransferase family 2 protein [Lachnospiraceae bacterium]|nr:glycosyltransferase family 2 protein [Lachnospiraceae bacterium]